ncbi:hypothetical protein TNCV_3486631 [Trichonephila clavipes]|nr:hypothetical protein TNCV_3486631 [Trichonephila clavipes]
MHCMYGRANDNTTELRYERITRSILIDEYRITEFFSGYIVNFVKHIRSTLPDMMLVDEELFHAEIVEVEIGGVAIYRPFGEFRRAKSSCHLYGAQGQRQAYLLPHATINFVGLDLTTSDRWH